MARAPVSKTGGWGFESLHSCQTNQWFTEVLKGNGSGTWTQTGPKDRFYRCPQASRAGLAPSAQTVLVIAAEETYMEQDRAALIDLKERISLARAVDRNRPRSFVLDGKRLPKRYE